jgi:DNA topoisomerase IB
MTAITIETGLRPGQVGNMANVKDPDTGESIEIETFGVTTMQPRHVKFIRDNFAELRFIGKKGTEQVAEMSDQDILKALKAAVDSTSLNGSTGMLFVTNDGQHVDYGEMQKYVADKWGDITPTDFRKLKATRTFYDKLKNRVGEMRKTLAKSVTASKGKLRSAVIGQIMQTLEAAAQDAQKALSHQDWKTTIKSYVDPRVVVNFLSQGGLDDTLEDILVNNKNVRLVFNFEAFVDRARKVAKAVAMFDVIGEGLVSANGVLDDMEALMDNLE